MVLLAIDQGTTSTRAILFDREARVLSVAQHAITQFYPQPGWVNHDAEEIWESVRSTVAGAIERAQVLPQSVAAIGITNQRETTVVWNRLTGKPLAPVIVWQSRQSEPVVAAIQARGLADLYQSTTGLQPDAYFSATKLALLLDENRELREMADAGDALFGTIDSWLIWKLTKGAVHATDVTNASRTMMFDIRALDWSQPLLDDLGIPRAMLPEVKPSSGDFGVASGDEIGAELPICGVAGDQHAALFGQACFDAGAVKCTYGTGAFLLMNTDRSPVSSANGLLTTIAWDLGDGPRYALEGSVFIAGAAVQWLRDGLGIIETREEVEKLAASVPDSAGVVFVPAMSGLGAPHWDAHARGLLIGLTRGATKAHIARATLEAIAQQVDEVISAMLVDSGLPVTELRIDGGAAANDVLAQMQADISGVTIVRPQQLETTSLGAAYLAGIARGVWQDQSEVAAQWREDRRFEPAISDRTRGEKRDRWRDAVSRAKGWTLAADPEEARRRL